MQSNSYYREKKFVLLNGWKVEKYLPKKKATKSESTKMVLAAWEFELWLKFLTVEARKFPPKSQPSADRILHELLLYNIQETLQDVKLHWWSKKSFVPGLIINYTAGNKNRKITKFRTILRMVYQNVTAYIFTCFYISLHSFIAFLNTFDFLCKLSSVMEIILKGTLLFSGLDKQWFFYHPCFPKTLYIILLCLLNLDCYTNSRYRYSNRSLHSSLHHIVKSVQIDFIWNSLVGPAIVERKQ